MNKNYLKTKKDECQGRALENVPKEHKKEKNIIL